MEMRTPVKAKRELLVTLFGVGYYLPVNMYERVYAKWEFLVTQARFRLFIIRDKIEYARKRRSERAPGKVTVSLSQGNRPDVW